MAMIGIISVAMTMVIIAGEIDLSVGSTAALAGVVVAYATVTIALPSALAHPPDGAHGGAFRFPHRRLRCSC
jgi:ribose/xylose/arabinose/galactoside ABC-type transport system permease subunit